jgi:hypothetical protein
MHYRTPSDRPRPGLAIRILRRIVFIAALPAILLASLILLPIAALLRLVGIGPRQGACCRPRRDDPDAAAPA